MSKISFFDNCKGKRGVLSSYMLTTSFLLTITGCELKEHWKDSWVLRTMIKPQELFCISGWHLYLWFMNWFIPLSNNFNVLKILSVSRSRIFWRRDKYRHPSWLLLSDYRGIAKCNFVSCSYQVRFELRSIIASPIVKYQTVKPWRNWLLVSIYMLDHITKIRHCWIVGT